MGSNSDEKTIITDGHPTIIQPANRKCACFIQYSGSALGRRYILDAAQVTIGRSPSTGIVIAEASVSREHARCTLSVNRVDLEDLGSSNGTFINDQKIQGRAPLRDGDIIRLGSVLLKYFAHDNIENVFHDKIYRMATIDAGTQIFNRKYMMESLESEFRVSKAFGRPLSLIFYDLDFFKKVNDEHGHNAGDFILKESAQIVKTCVRREDVFGRVGGEEFCIILPNTQSRTAFDLAERIRKVIEQHVFHFDGKGLKQTLSMGVSENRPQFNSFKELLDDADKKLYQSKNNGRNRVTV
jgi:diguanylate cyclase (GGDEF)-like protein